MTLTVLDAVACSNVCIGIAEGDSTLDFYGLFGPAPNQVVGNVSVTIDQFNNVLATNGHALPAGVSAQVSFTDPILSSFAQGAFEFTAVGPPNPWGFQPVETEFFCPIPGVPEPCIGMMMAVGFVFLAIMYRRCLKARRSTNGTATV